ncbi:acyl-CoA dehydrogenase family protein [Rhodococcus koreensis]|uniref:Acyl-[acyl-carrier-protein] dehydrogenase MbtN n=1 Tax=Rhodococcus koreensis TaxID=99653 RepID=A0A1H4X9B2_9NOCA|nr:acyl-CoA dehydrogenase family protein [Rhodococcus koreensis]SED02177.1 Acyl-CoA dehydrogenase [Rhodococcus koreensis]
MKRTVYNEDHEAFRKTIREFIAREVVPVFPEWEKQGCVPREFHHKFGALGISGFDIPEEYGGAGEVSYRYNAIITEEVFAAGVNFGNWNMSTGIILPYLLDLANEEQRRRWLPGIAAGDQLAIAMTEPGAGSDLAGITTSARREGEYYVLNGAKTFISNSSVATLMIVVCRTSAPSAEDRRTGLTLLVMDTSSEGFQVHRRLEKIGLKTSDTCEISFTEVKIPVENLLGEEGQAFGYLGRNLPRERLGLAVQTCAQAAAAIDFARDYVRHREIFGKSVASFQNTKFVLAECATEQAAAQALVDKAVELEDAGELTPADAAMAKVFCTEMAGRVIDKCLQLHGGYGYVLEYPIARLYADTRISRIVGGTSEVMKTIIAKSMGL